MESVRWAFNFSKWMPRKSDWALANSLIQIEEKERIARFMFKKDAKASLIGRLMMRQYAISKLKLAWNSIKFSRTDKGRPYLTNELDEKYSDIDFNISHQGEWVILAADRASKIGVDVMKFETCAEKDVSEFFRLMRRQFTESEWKAIKKSQDENNQLRSFYRHWCLKESVVKAIGTGIGFDLQRVSFESPTEILTTGNVVTDTKVYIDRKLDPNWCFEETLLDDMHPAVIALSFSDNCNDLKMNYMQNSKLKFEVLCFDDLIADSEEIIPIDNQLAEEFMIKEETPWPHKQ